MFVFLLAVQPFGHIPADRVVRLQFHIKTACNEINLFQIGALLGLSSNGCFIKASIYDSICRTIISDIAVYIYTYCY
jgi:hypothetical protein